MKGLRTMVGALIGGYLTFGSFKQIDKLTLIIMQTSYHFSMRASLNKDFQKMVFLQAIFFCAKDVHKGCEGLCV